MHRDVPTVTGCSGAAGSRHFDCFHALRVPLVAADFVVVDCKQCRLARSHHHCENFQPTPSVAGIAAADGTGAADKIVAAATVHDTVGAHGPKVAG